uniref:Probable cytosolic iron-sulfur protein assembly protein CIAO1 homolog n=1 Tax=Plectus sambesii TaxID=2011161 RepID=A0A914XRF3_9BILA
MSSAKLLASLNAHSERVWCVKWNRTGDVLASCGTDVSIKLWKKIDDSFECRSTLTDAHSRTVRSVSFSPCNRYLASTSFDGTAVVYELKDGDYEILNTLEGHENEVKCCAWSPSGQYLATCSRDKSVWIWELDEDEEFQVSSIVQAHSQDVKYVAWHPNEDLLVSCSYDDSIRFYRYDGDDWIVVQRIDGAHESTVWCAAFDGDGNHLATVGDDRKLKIWRRYPVDEPAIQSTWRCVTTIDERIHQQPIYTVDWCPLTGLIATGCGDNSVRLFRQSEGGDADAPTFDLVQTIKAHDEDVNCVAWNSKCAGMLATASDDCLIKIYQVQL